MATITQRAKLAWKAATGLFGDDAATQAFGLLTGILPGGVGLPPVRGTREYMRAYSQMPWLRAVASRISTATAQTEWQLYVQRGKNGKPMENRAIKRATKSSVRRTMLKTLEASGELEAITDHPLLDVLHHGNDMLTGLSVRKVTQLHLDLVGEAFWLKERNALGTVIGLWPIPADWVLSTPTPSLRTYRVQFRAWRGNIPDTEFVWFNEVDPANPYGRGTGTAQALSDELETDEYAAKFAKGFFLNSARPDLIVYPKAPQTLNEASVSRLEEDWLSKSQGFWKSAKPYFIGREIGIEKLETSFRAQQFVQIREHERNAIMQVFGLPPELLGVLSNSNRATISLADYLMAVYVVEPRLEFQRAVMQEKLVPEYDENLLLEFVSPVREDRDYQLDAAKSASWALDVDEWRALMGHTPKDDGTGKVHMVPINMRETVLGDGGGTQPGAPVGVGPSQVQPNAKPPAETPPAGGEPPKEEPAKPPADDATAGKAWRFGCAVDAELLAGTPDAAVLVKASLNDTEDLPESSQVAARGEAGMARALAHVWRDAAERVPLGPLATACAASDIEAVYRLFRLPDVAQAERQAIEPPLTTAGVRGIQLGARPLRSAGIPIREAVGVTKDPPPLGFDLTSTYPEAARYAEQVAGQLIVTNTLVTAEMKETVRALIARGIERGIDPKSLARMIRQTIGLRDDQLLAVERFRTRLEDDGSLTNEVIDNRVTNYALAQHRARAILIARTELIGALNHGQQSIWDRAVSTGFLDASRATKVWLTADDERLCVECEALGAEDPVPVMSTFSNGKLTPPAHPACLPGDSLVLPGARVTAVSKRRFDGDLVVLRTAGGRKLACTPDHPILTRLGWVLAGSLHVGDDIVCDLRRQWATSGDGDHQDRPTRIQEIADALIQSGQVVAVPMPASAEDLDSDGVSRQVAIVGTDGLCGDGREAAIGQPILQGALVDTDRPPLSASARLSAQGFEHDNATPIDLVSARDLVATLRPGHVAPFESFGLGLGPKADAALGQTTVDDATRDAELARQLVGGAAGQITLDQIVDVECQAINGDVFNLQAADGWYAAESIITHNCRCSTGLRTA